MPHLLPPGPTPAWHEDDPASQIAQIWEQDMWPALWPGITHRYASTGERDADLGGLGPLDAGVMSFTWGTPTLWVWTGATWSVVWTASETNPAWKSSTLRWRNAGGSELSVGVDGAKSSRHIQVGRTVTWSFYVLRAETSNVGTTYYTFDLPVPAQYFRGFVGSGLVTASLTEGGAEIAEPLALSLIGSETAVLTRPNGSRLASSSFAWKAGDNFQATITYEAGD